MAVARRFGLLACLFGASACGGASPPPRAPAAAVVEPSPREQAASAPVEDDAEASAPSGECAAPAGVQEDTEASATFDRGVAALEQARALPADQRSALVEEAIAFFERVVEMHPEADTCGVALFNIGVAYEDYLDRHEDAIVALRRVVDSAVRDDERSGNLLFPYRNFRYHAWRICRVSGVS